MLLQRHNSRICRKRRKTIQSDGQVAWQWAYSAFGDEKPTVAKTRFVNADLNQSFGSTTVPAVTFNLRYPGQYFDQESNLHYNLNRSYDSGRGRYTQADPIDLQGGWNRFSYVGQNPLSFTDLLGLQIVGGGAGAGGLGGAAIGGSTSGGGSRGGYDPRTDTYSPPKPGIGDRIIDAIKDICECTPPAGTICYFVDVVPPAKPHFPYTGTHYHLFQHNQIAPGICIWNKAGDTDVLPANATPCTFPRKGGR
jgi:RHS repeat-associated protein